MRLVTSSCLIGAVAALLGSGAYAQSVISAHSGLVHYVEGQVMLDNKAIDPKFGEFPDMKNDSVLRTEDGRAEILLSPGVFLRVAENSSVKMLSNKLTDTRLELLGGRALVECADAMKDDAVTLVSHGQTIHLVKNGLYEVAFEPSSLRVYQGEAMVESSGGQVTVHKGREATLAAVVEEHKFNTSQTDDLYNWSSRRSGYLAQANISSAKSMSSGSGMSAYGYGMGMFGSPMIGPYGSYYPYTLGFGYGGIGFAGNGMGWGNGWAWNPLFGMFTYVPIDGMYMDPFGYPFFSPYTVGYALPYYYGGGYNSAALGGGHGRAPAIGRTARTSSPYQLARATASARSAAFASRSSSFGAFSRGNPGFSAASGHMSTSAISASPSASVGMSSMGSAGHGGSAGGGGGRR